MCARCGSVPIFIILIGVLGACAMPDTAELESNQALVRSFLSATDAQDFAAYGQLLTDDVIANFPGGVRMNRDEVEQAERAFAVAFPDVVRVIEDLVTGGDRVVARTTIRGTHRGEFQGIPPTGRSIQTTAIVIYRISDGRIAES